jgi:hypothetical protein
MAGIAVGASSLALLWGLSMGTFQKAASLACALIGMWTAGSRADCIVEEQLWKVKGDAIARAGELATQQSPILDQLKVINNKAKDPTRPIGGQLGSQDVGRFSELRQRLMAIDLQQMLESDYSRDYEIIGSLFELAQKLYVGGKEPEETAPDGKPYGIILAMRYLAQTSDFQGIDEVSVPPQPEFEHCTLAAALHLIEHESLKKINQLPIKDAAQKLAALAKKSTTGKVDRNLLSPQDRAVYDSIVRTALAPAQHEQSFIGDIEGLKNIVRAADLKFQVSKKDAVDSGGDINAVGQTISRMSLDKRMRFGLGILTIVAETFPSRWMQEKQEVQRIMGQIGATKSTGKTQ